MFAEWPVLELAAPSPSLTLAAFSKETSECVSDVLMREVVDFVGKGTSANSGPAVLRLDTEEQLSWVMQVATYSLTLSYGTTREYDAMHAAVVTYLTWFSAITREPHVSVPRPLKLDPEKYISQMMNALRVIFKRRALSVCGGAVTTQPATSQTASGAAPAVEGDAAVSRQAREIRLILKAVSSLNANCCEEYRDFCWSNSLRFLLSVADSLLAGEAFPEGIGTVMAAKVVHTLLDEFLNAARLEYIPSPAYWKTLSVLCRRWRHQVSLIEDWARKVLSLSILIVQEIYGKDYCLLSIVDKASREFEPYVGSCVDEGVYSVLHVCWFEMLHLVGSPARIVDFDACAEAASSHHPLEALLASDGAMDSDGRAQMKGLGEEMTPYTVGRIRQCFFLACSALAKLVDVFYGDSHVSIEFTESDTLMREWNEASRAAYDDWLRLHQMPQRNSSGSTSAGDNGTLTANQNQATSTGSVSGGSSNILKNAFAAHQTSVKSRPASERSVALNTVTVSSLVNSPPEMPPAIPKPTASQFVWNYLRSNKAYTPYVGERQPKVARMLELFMDWLVQSALVRPVRYRNNEAFSDVTSQRSMSSLGADEVIVESAMSGGEGRASMSASDSVVTRRSFAHSTASSGDVHLPAPLAAEWPGVDGVSAGRAAAVGALCRIVCSKSSKETLADSQLAQFYKVIHEALLEKDRLVLCSLIYYGGSIFRLGLRGVEVLLPLFVLAIDIILTESTKLRLHPSISEVEMRRACLRALSTVISWPSTFGPTRIPDPSHVLFNSSGYTVAEEHSTAYIELRPRVHRNLVYSLRHELDPTNLHVTLAMCNILCEDSGMYDLCYGQERVLKEVRTTGRKSSDDSDDEKGYSVSVLRSVVSAICDNLCKPLWASDLSVCLAAIDCLNAIANLHPSILFHRKDLSTGFLIVSSLCRFIDTQLMKPPPLHSRDLHSSVVAAYSSLVIWLCAAPHLVETESCLATVAETIEFGITGGKNLPPSERKAASKRVHDAAEYLLYSLFAAVGKSKNNDIVDERRLLYRYGPQAIDTTKFRHFLIKQNTLLSIHEATKLSSVSQGHPSVFFVVRTPHHAARAVVAQLHAVRAGGDAGEEKENDAAHGGDAAAAAAAEADRAAAHSPFAMPPGFDKPRCKLDSVIPPVQPSPETERILSELSEYRRKLQKGESCARSSDERNVWLREPLASQLDLPMQPRPAPDDCCAGRVFLYDMGLISEDSFKAGDIVMLDSARSDEFYRDLHEIVDRSPTKLLQSVCIFYVRDGQRAAVDILENAMNIQNTSGPFCELLSELGEGVEVESHPHWTGNWATAFSSERKPVEERAGVDHYILDGLTHCLWWWDAQVEVAYTMPTERCRRRRATDAGDAPPTIVCSFDDSTDAEQLTPNRKLQRAPGMNSFSSGDERSTDRGSACSANSGSGAPSEAPPPLARSARVKSVSAVGSDTNDGTGSASERSSHTLVKRNADQRVFVVWLERIEDMRHFPIEDMFAVSEDGSAVVNSRSSRPDYVLIYLHQIESGLVRVHLCGNFTKCGLPSPLVDGCVVSNGALPSLLRLTVVSIARRKTLELENYQMVYCRRRQAIQEFARKYAVNMSYVEMLEALVLSS